MASETSAGIVELYADPSACKMKPGCNGNISVGLGCQSKVVSWWWCDTMWILRFTRTLELNRFVLPSDMKRTEQYQSGRKAFTGLFRLQPTLSSGTIAATTEQGDFVSAAETVGTGRIFWRPPEEALFFHGLLTYFFTRKTGDFWISYQKSLHFLTLEKVWQQLKIADNSNLCTIGRYLRPLNVHSPGIYQRAKYWV